MRLYKPPRIIDLGCGSGWLTAVLAAFGPALGVDLSDYVVETARKKYPHANFVKANFFDWNYPRNEFDIVVSQEVIEHVEDQRTYLKIASDLLRKGGFLILTTPNDLVIRAASNEQRARWGRQVLENTLTAADLKTLLGKHFEILRLTTIIPGYGTKGVYRLMNSFRVKKILEDLHLCKLYDLARCKMGLGLHLFAVARKR